MMKNQGKSEYIYIKQVMRIKLDCNPYKNV